MVEATQFQNLIAALNPTQKEKARQSNYIFQDIAKRGRAFGFDMKKNAEEAREWFRKEALKTVKVDPSKMIETAGAFENQKMISENAIGKMYLFNYDAKLKDVLPYWDSFPLIFPIEFYSNGSMLGINLHYLPPQIRASLMNGLYETMNNDKMNKTTKLRISYQILKQSSNLSAFKPCVKKYLFSHVKSPFSYVKPENWDMAMMLPSERFNKASKEKVWQDSMNKING